MKEFLLQERLKEHQNLLDEKTRQLNEVEVLRNRLICEIIELRGKVNLLKQLISQEERGKSESGPKDSREIRLQEGKSKS